MSQNSSQSHRCASRQHAHPVHLACSLTGDILSLACLFALTVLSAYHVCAIFKSLTGPTIPAGQLDVDIGT